MRFATDFHSKTCNVKRNHEESLEHNINHNPIKYVLKLAILATQLYVYIICI